MRSQFLLIPIAAVATVAAMPAVGEVYMNIEQAQKLLFPDATLTQNFTELDQDQYNLIIDKANVVPYSRKVMAWRVSTGGWFIIDQVRGRDDWITYAIGIDGTGAVKQIEILECLEKYDGIRNQGWLGQFYGRQYGATFTDIQTISGSTLSTGQMTQGVKRLLATIKYVLSVDSGTS